jgi:hypothetical protein
MTLIALNCSDTFDEVAFTHEDRCLECHLFAFRETEIYIPPAPSEMKMDLNGRNIKR